jgi:hypothetical protein
MPMRLLTSVLTIWFYLFFLQKVSAVEPEPFGGRGVAFKLGEGIEVEFHNCDLEQSDISAIKSAKGLHSLILGYLPEGVYFADTSLLEQLDECDELKSLQLVVNNLKESDLDFIFKLDSLRSLTIHSTYGEELNLTNQFAERLVKLPNLKRLDIADPGINGEFLGILKSREDWEALVFSILHRVRGDIDTGKRREK